MIYILRASKNKQKLERLGGGGGGGNERGSREVSLSSYNDHRDEREVWADDGQEDSGRGRDR